MSRGAVAFARRAGQRAAERISWRTSACRRH